LPFEVNTMEVCGAIKYKYLVLLLISLLPIGVLRADPFLQKVEKATPSRRVELVLNYFDTCRAVTQNKIRAFDLLKRLNEFASLKGDNQLKEYIQFLQDTQDKHSNTLTNRQKAELFELVAQKVKDEGKDQIVGVCRHFAGLYYYLNEEYGKAFDELIAADNIFRAIGYRHVPGIHRYLNSLALCYYQFREYDKTIKLLQNVPPFSSLSDVDAIQTPNTMALCFLHRHSQMTSEDAQKAEKYFKQALKIAQAQQNQTWVGLINGNLSLIYEDQKRWTEAIQVLRYEYEARLNDSEELPEFAAITLSRLYLEKGQLDSCKYFLDQSKKFYQHNLTSNTFITKLDDDLFVKKYCDVVRKYSYLMNDTKTAYRYLDSMLVLTNRMNKRQKSDQISLVEKRLMIHQHQTEVKTLEAERQKQRILFWVAVVILSLIAALFWRLFQLSMLRRRQETIISAEQKRSLQLEKQLVEEELQRAKQDLLVFVENLRERNDFIDSVTAKLQGSPANHLQEIEQSHPNAPLVQQLFNSSLLTSKDWEEFRRRFERVYPDFFAMIHIQFSPLTPAEERLLALAKLNIDIRHMSRILGISPGSVRKAKYRLKKRLDTSQQSLLADLLD